MKLPVKITPLMWVSFFKGIAIGWLVRVAYERYSRR
jgi:hypothetical protein